MQIVLQWSYSETQNMPELFYFKMQTMLKKIHVKKRNLNTIFLLWNTKYAGIISFWTAKYVKIIFFLNKHLLAATSTKKSLLTPSCQKPLPKINFTQNYKAS